MSNLKATLSALMKVVKAENTELRSGVYTTMKDTLSAKSNLMKQLEAGLQSEVGAQDKSALAEDLKRLESILKENDYLMKSAINSVRLAYKQLSVIRNTEKKVGAYNRFGKTLYMEDQHGLRNKLV